MSLHLIADDLDGWVDEAMSELLGEIGGRLAAEAAMDEIDAREGR